jgi:trk system potassium uptake protein TrkA
MPPVARPTTNDDERRRTTTDGEASRDPMKQTDSIDRHRPAGRQSVHVVVVGCGRVGSELAGALESTGHSVAIIDKNAKAFGRLPAGFAGRRIVGFGFDQDHLRTAGIDHADALAAVTSGDNSNILCARIARETFGIEHVVARIYDPRRALIYQRLGIPTVATVAWTTDQVLRRLLPGGDHPHDWVDPSSKICLLQRDLPPAAVGTKLALLNEPGRFWLTAVTRFGSAQVVTANLVGQQGDLLHFVAAIDAIDELDHRLEHPEGH